MACHGARGPERVGRGFSPDVQSPPPQLGAGMAVHMCVCGRAGAATGSGRADSASHDDPTCPPVPASVSPPRRVRTSSCQKKTAGRQNAAGGKKRAQNARKETKGTRREERKKCQPKWAIGRRADAYQQQQWAVGSTAVWSIIGSSSSHTLSAANESKPAVAAASVRSSVRLSVRSSPASQPDSV